MNKTIKFIILISNLALTGCNPDSALLYKKEGITNSELTLKNTSDFKDNKSSLALGNQKILVVPCEFKGERKFTSEMLDVVEKVFFASNLSKEDQAYFSLKEYYDLSSGHKLNITGEVTDVLEIPYTLEEIENGKYLPGVPAEQFINQYENASFLKDYDTNKDGYIDNIVFLYSSPTDNSRNLWAWVSNFATHADKENPQPYRHMWCGYDFLTNEMYRYDGHTPIHEFGHMLGLRDYYPSDNKYVALGGQNMMDYNILDHDPYTKMLLEWVDPLYYEIPENEEITIDLKAFQGSNEFILLNNSWNHSVMDEYLLIEYYTPTLINAFDSKTAYLDRPQGFSQAGIKIYHVDSRLAKCKKEGSELSFVSYTETMEDDSFYYIIGASNNVSDSYTDAKRQGRYKQITLIENKDFNNLQAGYNADDESLFYEGDVFGSTISNYFPNKNAFNNGEKLNLEIIVNSLKDDYANITIKHKGE